MKSVRPSEIVSLLDRTPLIVMLDIDGTLCEIVERPDDAIVPEAARESLRTLIACSASRLQVAFVTGRSVADAQRMLGLDGVVIYGNHGMERPLPFTEYRGAVAPDQAAQELRDIAHDMISGLAGFPGVTIEDKHFSLTLHFHSMDKGLLAALDAQVARLVGTRALRLAPGKGVINVLPAEGLTKGDAVLQIIRDAVEDPATASILFVGDDTTDEDAFRELRDMPNAVTVRVGVSDTSAAKLALADPGAVHELLALLAESHG